MLVFEDFEVIGMYHSWLSKYYCRKEKNGKERLGSDHRRLFQANTFEFYSADNGKSIKDL